MRQISHDPFARCSLVRHEHKVWRGTCEWCGQVKRKRNGSPYLYRYEVLPDDGRRPLSSFGVPRLFCSISCFWSYHA